MSLFSMVAAQFRRRSSRIIEIGSKGSSAGLRGTATEERLEGIPMTRVTIDAKQLKSGSTYNFVGINVTIKGDVPAYTSISGYKGQLLVAGNVGRKASLILDEPINIHLNGTKTDRDRCTHYEKHIVGHIKCLPIHSYDGPNAEACCTVTGLQAPFNKVAGLIVEGTVHKTAELSAGHGIVRIKRGPAA